MFGVPAGGESRVAPVFGFSYLSLAYLRMRSRFVERDGFGEQNHSQCFRRNSVTILKRHFIHALTAVLTKLEQSHVLSASCLCLFFTQSTKKLKCHGMFGHAAEVYPQLYPLLRRIDGSLTLLFPERGSLLLAHDGRSHPGLAAGGRIVAGYLVQTCWVRPLQIG